MLAVTGYTQGYVNDCRAKVQSQIDAYDTFVAAIGKPSKDLGQAIDNFEPIFFNNMVLALDSFFTHRLRGAEGKDGNPLNEVRVLCTSLTSNDGKLVVEKSIKLKSDQSVLGYSPDDEIALTRDDFEQLAEAFFAEIQARYL